MCRNDVLKWCRRSRGSRYFSTRVQGSIASDADPTTLRPVIVMDYTNCDTIARTLLADETQGVTLSCWRLGLVLPVRAAGKDMQLCGRTCIACVFNMDTGRNPHTWIINTRQAKRRGGRRCRRVAQARRAWLILLQRVLGLRLWDDRPLFYSVV